MRARPRPRDRSRDRERRDEGWRASRRTAAASAAADPADSAAAPGSAAATRAGPGRRSSRLGGALLIGAAAIAIVVVVILLVTGGSDDKPATQATASATPTATASPQYQQLGGLQLTSPTGGAAKGQMVLFADSTGTISFTIQGTGVPASGQGEAYAVWLTGGSADHRLGFVTPVGKDGKLGTSGPRDQDAKAFPKWFAQAKHVVVSRETSENTTAPGPVVLEGTIPSGKKRAASGG